MRRRTVVAGLGLAIVAAAAVVGAVVGQTAVPQEAIASAVTRTPALMERASALPVARTFAPSLEWQSNGSLCGPAALANVNRSLGEPEITEAAVLSGTGRCWTGICVMGLTLDELADVARAHTDREVTVLRDLSPDAFLDHMRHANDPDRRYIVNFARAAIFGAGAGHHSPVGGYLEDLDMVLVLDVNEKFGPWLVERERLYAAIDTFDGDKKRGLLMVGPDEDR